MELTLENISEQDTARIGKSMAPLLFPGAFIALFGDLGSGKTTFTKGLAAALGITDPVTSPTFALVNEYTEGRLPLFHFDLYRIDSYDDLYAIGFLDYLDRGGIIAAEWSENIEGLEQELSGDSTRTILKIRIEKTGENERRIKVSGHIVCPLCGSSEVSRAAVRQTGDTVRICEGCGALWTEPRISADNSTTFAHYMESRGLKPYWNELENKQYL